MNLRTEINPRYLMRMGLVGLFCIGMALYCFYDGKVAYPAQRERALAYEEFEEQNPELGQKDLFDEWKKFAAEKGWEPGIAGKEITPYGEPKKEFQFNQQLIMGGFIGLIGLFFFSKFLLNRGRWIEADDDGLRSSEKRELKFDQVTALNKKQWQNKGIAKVLYEVDGRKDKIVLDDCNYQRDTTNAILRHVEAAIGHDKIINGKPEPPLKATPSTSNGDDAST
ncbi:MAG: hypothetical protein GXP24_00265 [Planctomycetes bacterium]|nr:hypothetical protein [Planctomycetota bacterium]